MHSLLGTHVILTVEMQQWVQTCSARLKIKVHSIIITYLCYHAVAMFLNPFLIDLSLPCHVTALKMTRKPVKLQKENPAGCVGKVNRVNEIKSRENDGLKITDNSIM